MLLARLLYWTMPAVLLVWAVAGVRVLRTAPGWRRALLGAWPIALLAAALTVAVAVLLPPAMRMQFDETSLCGTAQNMHEHRLAMMTMAAVPGQDGALQVLDYNLDKRPPLFPFLVSVLHDLTGYRVANAFVVNLGLLFGLLTVLGAAVRARLGLLAGLAAPLLAVAVPLLPWVATSAGFELLAAFLLLVVILAADAAVRDPTAERIGWLLANGLLFAQARYESIVVFAVVLALVGWRVRSRLWAPGTRWLWGLSPLLLACVVLQMWHSRDPGFYLESGGAPLVGLGNFTGHVGPFLATFFAPSLQGVLLGAPALAGLLAWMWLLARRRTSFFDLLAIVPTLAATAIVLAWFYGDVTEPTALRLFLPVAVLGGVAPLLLLRAVDARWMHTLVLAGAALLAGLRLPLLAIGQVLPKALAPAVLEVVDAALRRAGPDPKTTVVVTSVAQYVLLRGQPAMPANALQQRGAGAAKGLLFVTTPLDAQLAPWFGDVAELVRRSGAVLEFEAYDARGELAVAVYWLFR